MKLCLGCRQPFAADDWECRSCGHGPEPVDGFPAFAPELARENNGFREDVFNRLAELEARNFWFRSRNRLIAWALQQYFPTAKRVLEIGCGTGFVLRGLREANPTLDLSGSELFVQGLACARRRLPGINLVQMDARDIPYVDEFDVVGAFDVIEHIQEDELVLQQMLQSVKPGGGILITVPQHRFLWSVYDEYGCHKRRYERMELVDKVRRAGFSVLRVTSFVTSLLPLMMLSRLARRRRIEGYDPLSELRIGPLSNAVFEQCLGIERYLVKAGVSFPMGGSLLLAAQRPNGSCGK